MKTKYLPFLIIGFSTPLRVFAGPEVIPVVNLEVFGGQTRYDGDEASFYGNGSWSLASVLKFSDKNTLIPSYAGALRRTVQVQELVGGALLTQSQQTHILKLKDIHRFGESRWKGKAQLGYTKELLRETKDESWGDGIFDYDKYLVGFEAEREGEKFRSLRTGFDVYFLRYPNYETIASREFGSEITAGGNVLDLDAVDWLTSAEVKLYDRGYLNASLLLSPRLYRDARIVEETGLFNSDKRRDFYIWNAYNVQHTFRALKPQSLNMVNVLGLFTSIAYNSSNQNNYDARQTIFNENYYDYREWQAGPRWGAKLGNRWDVGLSYTFTQRRYSDRPVQTPTGAYTGGQINNEIQLYSSQVGFYLLRGISLNASVAHQISKSNQKYEQTYKYNYESTHFFIGVSYAN